MTTMPTDWRAWAMVGYPILTSLLLLVIVSGFALGSVLEFDFDPGLVPGWLYRWIGGSALLSVGLAWGGALAWLVLSRAALKLGVPRTPPLLVYPLAWLLNADQRLDELIQGNRTEGRR